MTDMSSTEPDARQADRTAAAARPLDALPAPRWHAVLFARLLIGVIVMICAEVFSGASLGAGLWNPFTLIVTFWLYFAHFFLFTTLAVRTGRTSLSALYLWGVLFGLYEAFITKVIWSGYSADGKLVIGQIGPYGLSEISMVFIFHPVMSFILPLAIACLLCPALRGIFPQLTWVTGPGKLPATIRIYIIAALAPIMAINAGSLRNLAANLAFAIAALWVLRRLARPALVCTDARRVVCFGRWGMVGLCAYLAFLYAATYHGIHPEALPSAGIQLFTFVFYALAIAGLWLHHRREVVSSPEVVSKDRPLRRITVLFAVMLALGLLISAMLPLPILYLPVVASFYLWPFLGFALTALALARGMREYLAPKPPERWSA